MGQRISLSEALDRARSNKFGRMLGRAADNRVEPECWPHIEPTFRFTRDQLFFAIGSCFAKNISKRLLLDGYKVHGGVVAEGNRRNRYTPAAIYQELAWAKRIFDRDDMVREEDVRPLLLELGPGRWTDIWCRPAKAGSPSLESAIAVRKELYSYLRGAFIADVVIITLGLIEAWWDDLSRSYVEFDTPWARLPDKARFKFERLSFDQCKDYLERSLDLLADGKRRILVTTSPVVLARTFTADDIIVANTHSKSVLRAVAGEVTAERANADYFPSYEIATITRRPEVWEDDLIHINPNFVARIMQHVSDAYLPGSVTVDGRALMQMANLTEARQFDAAQRIYEDNGEAVSRSDNPAVHVAAMRLALHRGEAAVAGEHALRLDPGDAHLFVNHPEWMFEASRALCASGSHQASGNAVAEQLWRYCRERPDLFQQVLVASERSGDKQAVAELVERIRMSGLAEPILTQKAAAHLQVFGRYDEALELCERQLAASPDHPLILTRIARIELARNESRRAIEALRRLTAVDPQNTWAKLALARTLMAVGDAGEALCTADELLESSRDDPDALAIRARALWKLNKYSEARVAARAAAACPNATSALLRQIRHVLESDE